MSTPPPLIPPRSKRVTVVAWTIMVLAALMLPISACSALMVAVGSHGTANTTVLGYVTVVLGPVFALVLGFGLLQRKAWGLYGVLALLFVVLLSNGYDMATAPMEDVTTIGPDGVLNTRLGGGASFLWPFVVVPAVLIAVLLTPRARREFSHAD
jgi:hypothetical protein